MTDAAVRAKGQPAVAAGGEPRRTRVGGAEPGSGRQDPLPTGHSAGTGAEDGADGGATQDRCRCHRCREADAVTGRSIGNGSTIEDWRQKLASWALRHGRASTYSHHGCRCAACSQAWERYRQAGTSDQS
jgi:hypothetical protein